MKNRIRGGERMRLRNIPGSRETIAASEFVVHEDVMREKKGNWNTVFGNDNPISIEVGMGKGKFLMELAQQKVYHRAGGTEPG